MKRKVYLAHSISTQNQWVEATKKILVKEVENVQFLDPARYGLDNDKDWKQIIYKNMKDIQDCNMVVALITEQPSWGVICELNVATLQRKPVWGLRERVTSPRPVSPYEKFFFSKHDKLPLGREYFASLTDLINELKTVGK